ncbi:MAG TPA: TMEM14 family protein [Waddliaceae bacterium]
MKFNGAVVLIYGILVLLGGLIGYLAKGSLASLFSGSLCGALLIASALGIFRTSVLAFFTALGISSILGIFFAIRYYVTGSIVPAGGMALLSLIVFLLLLTAKSPRALRR